MAPVTAHTDTTNVSSPSLSYDTSMVSYKTLQDFYTLLDRIERTSYVGAVFLEAYAEKLSDDMCKDCWFKHNVKLDMFSMLFCRGGASGEVERIRPTIPTPSASSREILLHPNLGG
jgi:hypothetical protein